MTETPELFAEPASVAMERPPAEASPSRWHRSNRLSQVAAWVGIAAGVVVIIAVIFFSGFFTGRYYSDSGTHPYGGPPTMGPYDQMGPATMGPGGQMGPGQQPSTSAGPTPNTPRPQGNQPHVADQSVERLWR